MKIAFVGIKRDYAAISAEYRSFYNQYHLELPYYYAKFGGNNVTIVTTNHDDKGSFWGSGGELQCITEERYRSSEEKYDVVIHWRKWFPDLYRKGAVNVINCQDHSFSSEWTNNVLDAYKNDELYGILCFPKWHEENLRMETFGFIDESRLISGLTLGVDTEIYKPSDQKDSRELLWASDPGRGLQRCLQFFFSLYQKDRSYRLNICYPDYVRDRIVINHPAVKVHGIVPNGEKLWSLFNNCSTLPYTSCFKEPSSRAHRQAMAAGCAVFYPPSMGTPSDLIEDGSTGFVRDIDEWVDLLIGSERDGTLDKIRKNAREFAVRENWQVQAGRFNSHFGGILNER